jgi:hypothetical protein
MLSVTRRQFLVAACVTAAAACGRVPAPPARPTSPASTPELDAWRAQASAILIDALDTLRTFEVFAAYRVAGAPPSDFRPPSTLAWDPPAGAAWDEATHLARGLHGRTDQLVQAITNAQIDPSLWREQRALADQVHDLLDVGDALRAYRDRIDRVPPGDAVSAWSLLDRAWLQWEAAAVRFGLSRSEPIGCAA